jgi:multidrug efflux system membrane fusion protein
MRSSLLIALLAGTVLAGCSKPEPVPEPVRSVRTLIVTAGQAGATHEYAAEIRARTESRLGFRVGGKIVRRQVDLGDTVRAGQVLAQLDPQDLRLGQDAARASLQAAQAQLNQTAADHKRFKELRDQGFISSAELERRATALASAQAQFDQARAQASVQGNQAGYAALVADTSGVITGVDAEPGMVVSAGTPVVRLAHDGPRDAVFAVPEDKVEAIRAMASAGAGRFSVRLWGATGAPLPVTVREISASADTATRTFLVKADLGVASSSQVRLGQTATLVVDMPKASGITRLPLSALKEEGGHTVVWLVDEKAWTVRPQPVQLAGAEGNEVIVAGGLVPGQRVVTAGVHVLSPGQKVRLYDEPAVARPPSPVASAGSAPTAASR